MLFAAAGEVEEVYGQPLLSGVKDEASGERGVAVLSHHDSRQKAPFWGAYGAGVDIFEIDLRMRGEKIVVTHDRIKVPGAPLLRDLYIDPIVSLGEEAYGLKLMFDLKEAEVMPRLARLLGKYPETFARGRVEVIVSGNRPPSADFSGYSDYIWFDGDLGQEYGPEALERIWTMSNDIAHYTRWNGKGAIAETRKAAMLKDMEYARAHGKKVRFWGTADNVNTWITLHDLGADVIGTDSPARCTGFFDALGRSSFVFPETGAAYLPAYTNDGAGDRVKNVIVIVGDGMGQAHIAAAETAGGGRDGRSGLSILNIKNIGFHRNHSLDSYVTDSSAAATAFFTGEKTHNNMLSVRPDASPIANTSEILTACGVKVGIVSTGDITDATPAANWAHSMDRNDSESIAGQLPASGLSLLAGPGRDAFDKRADGRNVLREMRELGYTVVFSADSIAMAGERVVCLDDGKFGDYLDSSHTDALVSVMKDAIRVLDDPGAERGFFLMFESARIDYASHMGDLPRAVVETIALDAVVAEALRFADADGKTIVIVTGDHETGGLALIAGDRNRANGKYIAGCFTSDDHTGVFVPVFAYGPGAHLFRGFYENTDIFDKIISLYGFDRPCPSAY